MSADDETTFIGEDSMTASGTKTKPPVTVDVNKDDQRPFTASLTAAASIGLSPRRNGAVITAALANAIFPAVQALIADRGATGQAGGTPLNRDRIVRWRGLGAVTKTGWLFDYLEMIGFLTIERHYNMPVQGRARDTFICSVTPPPSYVGPHTFDELRHALYLQGSGRPPVFGLFDGKAGEAR